MPNRILKAKRIDSHKLDELLRYFGAKPGDSSARDAGVAANDFYVRMILAVDDYGRFDGRPMAILSECYPVQLDLFTVAEIESWLVALESCGLVERYEVDGKPYIQLTNWQQRARAKTSNWPAPQTDDSHAPDTCRAHDSHMPDTRLAHAPEDEDEDEDEGADEDGVSDVSFSGSSCSLSGASRLRLDDALCKLFGRDGNTRHPPGSPQVAADQTTALRWVQDGVIHDGNFKEVMGLVVDAQTGKRRPMAWLTDRFKRKGWLT